MSLIKFFPLLAVLACPLIGSPADSGAADPCWQARTLDGDPLMFIRAAGDDVATAWLLRVPEQTPTLRSASGEEVYALGRDFDWTAGTRELRVVAGSRIPVTTTEALHPAPGSPNAYAGAIDGKSWLMYSQGHFFHDRQCAAFYRAADDWTPPRVAAAPAIQLARIRAKLKMRQPIMMVVLGDSISTGLNASATGDVPPRQPAYVELVAAELHRRFGSEIRVKNLAVSGKSSPWGLAQAPAVIAARPDLFLCAFGMNDASAARAPAAFADNLRRTVARVQTACPGCDAILVAPMTANPEWTGAAPALYPAYAAALKKLAGPGVAAADVTTVWTALLDRKRPLDLSGNGLNHPNDFGHRVYADVILETIGRGIQ